MKFTTDGPTFNAQGGFALFLALTMLLFLSLVGGALLSSSTVDLKVATNYETNSQLLFLTEAGIEAARESLRAAVEAKINQSAVDTIDTVPEGISEVLKDYDGADSLMSDSVDIDTLLNPAATDDVRYLDTVTITAGSRTIGTYTVFLRNDAADGVTSNTDTNEVVTLVSVGVIGNSEMLIEVMVRKGRFPDMPAALTLDGNVPPNGFGPGSSINFFVDGYDAAGGNAVNSVGVINSGSDTAVTDEILANPDRSDAYCGSGTTFAEPCDAGADQGPDVGDVSGSLDPRLTTVSGLEAIVSGIESNVTSTTCPTGTTGSVGSPVVVVVSGDCTVNGNDTGWGVLVVKGALTMGGNVEWNGLVIVVDPAECDIASGGTHYTATLAGGTVLNGGLFVASTYNNTLSDVCIDTQGGGNGGLTYDSEKIRNAARGFPFKPIAIRHY